MAKATVKGCRWALLMMTIALYGGLNKVIGQPTLNCNPVVESSSSAHSGGISEQLASVIVSSLDQLKREIAELNQFIVEIQRKQQESEDFLRSNFDLTRQENADMKRELRQDIASIKQDLLQLSLTEDITTRDSYEQLRTDQVQLKADLVIIKERVLQCTTNNFTAENFDRLRKENAEMQAEARAGIADVIMHVEAAGNDTQSGIERLSEEHVGMKSGIERTLSDTKHKVEKVLLTTESLNASRLSENSEPCASTAIKPRDCGDVMHLGFNSSDVYTVYAGTTQRPVLVYCDMTTDGGGWTVFQRRQDGSENFYRNWLDYANGFGDLQREFWLGNDNLHLLTNGGKRYKLRIDLADFNNNTRYAEYSDFRIASSWEKYKLVSLGSFSGDAGDSLTTHSGKSFSTLDRDNDFHTGHSCAVVYKGAWWYHACHHSNLNGHYYGGSYASYAEGVEWHTWTKYHYSLRFTEMKFRPIY